MYLATIINNYIQRTAHFEKTIIQILLINLKTKIQNCIFTKRN